MPIVLKHEAAGITPNPENPRLKYGMTMALQQQRADQEMRQRAQDAQYDMQRMGAMGAMREMREPSIGEDDAMLEQEIRGGMYDPDTVRSMREDQRAMRMILRDRNIDATQRSKAIDNLRSRMRMARSTGRVQPMMQQMPQQVGQGGQQQRRLSGREAFRADPKLEDKFLAMVDQQAVEAGVVLPYKERLQRALNFYDEREAALSEPDQNQQPPAQNQPQAMGGQPQASYTGGDVSAGFGATPVMAQGGFQQNGGQQYDQSMVPAVVAAMRQPVAARNNAGQGGMPGPVQMPGAIGVFDPKGVAMEIQSNPPKYKLNDGTVVGSAVRNGQYVPDMSAVDNSLVYYNGGESQSNAPVGQSAYQPTGGYTSPEVFGAANVLANTAQPQAYDPAAQQGRGYISIAPQQGRSQQQQVPPVAQQPPVATNGRDAAFNAAMGSNLDTAYDIANMNRSPGTNYFNPENPEYAKMRGADQSIVNPQRQTLGQPGGRYGLGMIDYGINPATGNRVTVSIRPGGIMPEYDEPIGPPGTAMAGRKGSVTWQGRKGKKNDMVSPGEQLSNANPYPAQTPVAQKPVEATQAPAPMRPTLSRNDPKVKDSLRIAADSKATEQQQDAAIETLRKAGYTSQEVQDVLEGKNQPGSATAKPLPSQNEVLSAYETLRNNPTSNRAMTPEMKTAVEVLKAYGMDEKTINNLRLGYRPSFNHPEGYDVMKAYEVVMNARESNRALKPETRSAIEVLKKNGWSEKDISNLRLGSSERRSIEAKPAPEKPTGSTPTMADLEGGARSAPTMADLEGGVRSAPEVANPASSSLLNQLEQADRDVSQTENAPSEQENVRTWTDKNGKTFEGSIVEGSIEAASKQPAGQQVITVKRKDGQVFNIPVSRLSDEDVAYLEAAYKIKQGVAWTERNDWGARYKPGQKYKAKRTKLEKNQSMNPRTSGYETERRDENPEYRQRDERTPSARTSIAKKTG